MFLNSQYYFPLALKKIKKWGEKKSLLNKGLIVCFVWEALCIRTPFPTVLPELFVIFFFRKELSTVQFCLTFKLLPRTGHLQLDGGISTKQRVLDLY